MRHTNIGPSDAKIDSKNHLNLLPELADLNNCNNTLYFEARRHEDLYLWAAKTPNGPSIKMHVQNVHTMDELKLTGNCLKGSRGLVSFDKAFDETGWGRLTKELFVHVRTHNPQLALLLTTNDDSLDFRCATVSQKGKALCRSYSHILPARLKDMVPELPGL